MATQNFEGLGTTLAEARAKANEVADAWMNDQRRSGLLYVDAGRGSVTTKTPTGQFLCAISLQYNVQQSPERTSPSSPLVA